MLSTYPIIALISLSFLVTVVPAAAQDNYIYNGSANWSPDGTKIVFSSNRGGDYDIWIMDADGQNQVNLTPDMSGDQIIPVWSPDGEQILFTSGHSWEGSSFWVMSADGSDKTEVVPESEISIGSYKWSPDSNYIAYKMDPYGYPSFWIVNLESLEQQQFFPDIDDDELLTFMFWTTDELEIEYDVDYITVADDLYLAVLYHDYMGPNRPCISNDWCLEYEGLGVAIHVFSQKLDTEYTLDIRSNEDIVAAHPDDQPLIEIATLYPDGRVVVVTRRQEIQNLWVLNASSGDVQLILPGSETNVYFAPKWSPDGQQILFTWQGDHNAGADLWLINADGTNVRNLTCDNTDEACIR